MRQIKFRAWNSREKVMLSPEDVEHGNYALGSHGLMVAHEKDTEHLWNVDHFLTPLFWTGLTDRNGVDIYEGDIHDLNGEVGVVEYHDGTYFVIGDCVTRFLYQELTDYKGKVIGNKFEHPSLLGGTSND